MTVVSRVIVAFLQIISSSLIPFIWWFVTARKQVSFSQWIGLKAIPKGKERALVPWIFGVEIVFLIVGIYILSLLRGVSTGLSAFRGAGLQAIPAILIYALFQTSFPEELLFRGFLLKRMQGWFGFQIANLFQAVLFGLVHGVLFFQLTSVFQASIIIVFTSAVAWFIGYINEKKADGSILPGWAIHAMANLFSGLVTAFLLFGL